MELNLCINRQDIGYDRFEPYYPSREVFQLRRSPLSGTSVPLSPIYVSFNINPGEPNGDLASGFRTEPNSEQTHNIPATLPGDSGYSPLWLRVVYDNADWPSVHDLATALKAKVIPAKVLTPNCPIVFIEP